MVAEQAVRAALHAGRVDPVYLLVGDDEIGKKGLLDAFAALVDEHVRAFNVEQFYAKDADLVDVVAAVRTYPFIASRRIVFLLRAEELFKRRKGRPEGEEGEMTADDRTPEATTSLASLEGYLANPVRENCLVIVAADIDRGTRVGKLLLNAATVVEFWGLRGASAGPGDAIDPRARARRQLEDAVRQAGMTIDADAAEHILDHAGTDIGVLRADIERVLTYSAGRRHIDADDVRALISGAALVDPWALVDAVKSGDAAAALRHLALALDAGASPYMVLGQLGWFVRARLPELAESRVPAAVDLVFDTDLALKSSGGDARVLLERLVVELCRRRRGEGGARELRGR